MEIIQARRYELVEVLYLLKVCIYELTSRGCLYWDLMIPQMIDEIEKGNIYIVKTNDISVGLIILDPTHANIEKYNGMGWEIDDKALHINRLVVHPKWLCKGIGDKLIMFAEKYAVENGFESIRFEVYAENKPVIDLFNTLLYKKAGEVHLPFQIIPFICLEKKIN